MRHQVALAPAASSLSRLSLSLFFSFFHAHNLHEVLSTHKLRQHLHKLRQTTSLQDLFSLPFALFLFLLLLLLLLFCLSALSCIQPAAFSYELQLQLPKHTGPAATLVKEFLTCSWFYAFAASDTRARLRLTLHATNGH